MTAKITISSRQLQSTLRALREVGYANLTPEEKRICEAFDTGTINVTED